MAVSTGVGAGRSCSEIVATRGRGRARGQPPPESVGTNTIPARLRAPRTGPGEIHARPTPPSEEALTHPSDAFYEEGA